MGDQGIGKLREVAVIRPTEVKVLPLYDQESGQQRRS